MGVCPVLSPLLGLFIFFAPRWNSQGWSINNSDMVAGKNAHSGGGIGAYPAIAFMSNVDYVLNYSGNGMFKGQGRNNEREKE